MLQMCFNVVLQTVVDPGGAASMHPPNRTQFFCFCICFHQKVCMLEIGAPPWVSTPSQWVGTSQKEILDPQLAKMFQIGVAKMFKGGVVNVFECHVYKGI